MAQTRTMSDDIGIIGGSDTGGGPSRLTSFRVKVAAGLILLLAAVILALGYLTYEDSAEALAERVAEEITQVTATATLRVERLTAGLAGNTLALSQSPAVLNAAEAPNAVPLSSALRDSVAKLFAAFARNQPSYVQIRFIDERGMEVVRVDSSAGMVRILSPDEMQSKAHSPYFNAGMQLKFGEVHISPMTLNRENEKIEVPYRPMVRSVTPVFNADGARRGVVVINDNPTDLLRELSVPMGEVYVLNENGYFLRHPDRSKEFGFDLNTDYTIDDLRPKLAQKIRLESDQLRVMDTVGSDGVRRIVAYQKIRYNPTNAADFWTVLVDVPRAVAVAPAAALRGRIALLGFVILALASIIGFVLAGRLSARIVSLAAVSRTISTGDLNAQAPVKGSDEIALLGRAFNDMTASLRQMRVDRIKREEELKRANASLEAFSYSVSHDLRAPLRAVDGFAEALDQDFRDTLPDDAGRYIARIRAGARCMGQLIDDLLILSRVERRDMVMNSVDLSALAANTAVELRNLDPSRSIEIQIEPGLQVRGDEHLVKILLSNLVGNAWKFTEKSANARIEIRRVRDGSGKSGIEIRDNGVGFDMTYANKLFLPFQRLHSDKEFSGTGIGLAIVARIIERHGGWIEAESEVGRGASFKFDLMRRPDV